MRRLSILLLAAVVGNIRTMARPTSSSLPTYRGDLPKLSFCPRCEVTCGCGGHRVAQASQAVPRSTWTDHYIDMGFWCWCCFIQTWDLLDDATKSFLVGIAKKPEQFVSGASVRSSLEHATDQWESACLAKGFGTEWRSLNDERNMQLRPAKGVGDLPFAVDHVRGSVAVSAGVARLIERAALKDWRARRC